MDVTAMKRDNVASDYASSDGDLDISALNMMLSMMNIHQNESSQNNYTTSTPAALSYLMDRYVAPVIVILGLFGNIISLIVFSERSMQRRSSSVYLAALSAVDVAFLTCVLLSWTAKTRFDLYAVDGLCQTFTYVTYVSSFLGVWYVVGFTMERYIAVHYPLRRQSLCTAGNARRSVIAVACFAGVAYSFGAWTSGVIEIPGLPDSRICAPLDRYAVAMTVVHTVDTIITLLLPFLIITVLNLRIAVTVVRCNRARRNLSTHSVRPLIVTAEARTNRGRRQRPLDRDGHQGEDAVGGPRGEGQTAHRRWSQFRQQNSRWSTTSTMTCARYFDQTRVVSGGGDQFRATKLLLTVSAAFLLLNLPRHATRTYALIDDSLHPFSPPSPQFLACQTLFKLFYYLQFAVNIVLYATIGRNNFVGALRRIAHRTKRRLSNGVTCIQLALNSLPRCLEDPVCIRIRTSAAQPEVANMAERRRSVGGRQMMTSLSADRHQMAVLSATTSSRETPA